MQHALGAAERRVRLTKITRKSQEAGRLRREEMTQRNLAGRFGAAQQVRQALLAVQRPQAACQVDPVPRLFELIVAEPALQLAFEDAAGVVGADFGEGTHLHHVLHARPKAGLDGIDLAPLQQPAQVRLGRLHDRFIELGTLKKLDVLTRDRRELAGQVLPTMQAAQQDDDRCDHHRQQHSHHDHDLCHIHRRRLQSMGIRRRIANFMRCLGLRRSIQHPKLNAERVIDNNRMGFNTP